MGIVYRHEVQTVGVEQRDVASLRESVNRLRLEGERGPLDRGELGTSRLISGNGSTMRRHRATLSRLPNFLRRFASISASLEHLDQAIVAVSEVAHFSDQDVEDPYEPPCIDSWFEAKPTTRPMRGFR